MHIKEQQFAYILLKYINTFCLFMTATDDKSLLLQLTYAKGFIAPLRFSVGKYWLCFVDIIEIYPFMVCMHLCIYCSHDTSLALLFLHIHTMFFTVMSVSETSHAFIFSGVHNSGGNAYKYNFSDTVVCNVQHLTLFYSKNVINVMDTTIYNIVMSYANSMFERFMLTFSRSLTWQIPTKRIY